MEGLLQGAAPSEPLLDMASSLSREEEEEEEEDYQLLLGLGGAAYAEGEGLAPPRVLRFVDADELSVVAQVVREHIL